MPAIGPSTPCLRDSRQIVSNGSRSANLKSGRLDFVQGLAPSDLPQLKSDTRFKIAKFPGLGYLGVTISV